MYLAHDAAHRRANQNARHKQPRWHGHAISDHRKDEVHEAEENQHRRVVGGHPRPGEMRIVGIQLLVLAIDVVVKKRLDAGTRSMLAP